MPLTIAYLVNQYPKVSHSFIRREIQGLEEQGVQVKRFSIRSCQDQLVDEADHVEFEKTQIMLAASKLSFLISFLQVLVTRPTQFFTALAMTIRASKRSERGLLLHLFYLVEACWLLQQFSQADVTHVHAHFGTNSTMVVMLCRLLGGPTYSFTVHGPEEFDKPIALSLGDKIKHAAFVVAISSFGTSQLYRWCDYDQWPKIQVVHCGVDDAFLRQAFQPIPEEPGFVCVGRLCEQKGQLLLMKAAQQLAAEGHDFKVTLVGDGPMRSEVEALIDQYKLHNHIEITGWASGAEVQRHLLSSRAMVLPSFAEGLPVVIMEALALGRPVVSTYVAGIPELVKPGECGWLVPPGSVEALTNAMRSVLKASSAELEEMGRAGASAVAQQHDIRVESKKLGGLLQALTEPASAQPDQSPLAISYSGVLPTEPKSELYTPESTRG